MPGPWLWIFKPQLPDGVNDDYSDHFTGDHNVVINIWWFVLINAFESYNFELLETCVQLLSCFLSFRCIYLFAWMPQLDRERKREREIWFWFIPQMAKLNLEATGFNWVPHCVSQAISWEMDRKWSSHAWTASQGPYLLSQNAGPRLPILSMLFLGTSFAQNQQPPKPEFSIFCQASESPRSSGALSFSLWGGS